MNRRTAVKETRLEEASRTATRLLGAIYGSWRDEPMGPGPDWYASHGIEGSIGEEGVGLEGMLEDFERWILKGAIRIPSPRYVGLVNSAPLPAGPLADLLISAMDNNAGAESQGPSAAAVEREVLNVLGEWSYGTRSVGGMLLPGGSAANLQGLVLARERAFPEWSTSGPSALSGAPVLYVSDAAHFSTVRAGITLGLGRSGVRSIPTTGRGSMIPQALADAVAEDRQAGRLPFAVVATTGTTGTGAFDPVDEIGGIARKNGLWLHVDACYGGATLLLPELGDRFRGMRKADSIAIDPHKWFYVPLTCSALLTPNDELATRTFDISTSYIPGAAQVDPYRRGIPTSRRASAITLWAVLRAYGTSTIRDMVRNDIDCMRRLEAALMEAGFEILPDGELSVACARWSPEGRTDVESDGLQSTLTERAVESGEVWFGTVEHGGRTWLRFNLLNPYANPEAMRNLAERIVSIARTLE